ncbi:hypothetical protein HYS96_01420 [Candidatus Daviesbacteria bacterium]|nr:hypothetical protein [Candidatus Daviesbacteria bacterium]
MSVENVDKNPSGRLGPATLRELVGDLSDHDRHHEATDRIEALVRMGPSLGTLVRGLSLEPSLPGRSSRSYHRSRGRRRFSAPGFDF